MKSQNKRLAVLVDLRKCIGCNTCAMACKSENDVPLGVWRSWVKRVEKDIILTPENSFFLSSAIIVKTRSA